MGLIALLAAFGAATAQAASAPSSSAVAGKLDGIWYWALPTTPNGLVSTQSWSGAAATPEGVYVAGMDHKTNSALFRLDADVLRYVGDARSASEAAHNWMAGEVAEKFHTRPVWHDGRVYVANLNSSTLDDTYLGLRGFHWYAHGATTGRFVDLSAGRPGGTAAAHGGLIAQVVDPARDCIYGALAPTGDIYRYDIVSGASERLGRPDYRRPYVYPGRAMWVARSGRLYFTAGSAELAYYGAPYDPAIFNHVYFYDPHARKFGEMKSWKLHDERAIDASQCFRRISGIDECFLSDNVGHIYKFSESAAGEKWSYLGDIGQDTSQPFGYAWVFHVFDRQNAIYIVTTEGRFFEFDLVTRKASELANLKSLEPMLADKMFFYGHDAKAGSRFYFTAFGRTGSALLVAIDPKLLKAALAAR
ncbi:MAG: hypothetical protein JNM75_06995 [Rhodospirillales bacterium]|nr:hypothetical protein [Rhodospirillales bacterium]